MGTWVDFRQVKEAVGFDQVILIQPSPCSYSL